MTPRRTGGNEGSYSISGVTAHNSPIAMGSKARASNTVHGNQVVALPELDVVRRQLEELRRSGDSPLSEGELDDAESDLGRLEQELKQPEPRAEQVTRLLDRLTSLLSRAAGIGGSVAELARAVHAVLGPG